MTLLIAKGMPFPCLPLILVVSHKVCCYPKKSLEVANCKATQKLFQINSDNHLNEIRALLVSQPNLNYMPSRSAVIRREISTLIHLIRGKRVMLDTDLADLYGVETKQLNRAVKRNHERFPEDFMFQLSDPEVANLRCQIGTSSLQHADNIQQFRNYGGRRYNPYAFTEQGVAMLSSVLESKGAAIINIQIIRAFVAMRDALSTNVEFARKLEQLEYRLGEHDEEIASLFEAIKQLMTPLPNSKKNRIGF